MQMLHFPAKSGKSGGFAARRGLTGGLPDVRKDGPLPRGLIRDLNIGPGVREIAFKAPSLPYQSSIGLHCQGYQGIDPDAAFETSGEERGSSRRNRCDDAAE